MNIDIITTLVTLVTVILTWFSLETVKYFRNRKSVDKTIEESAEQAEVETAFKKFDLFQKQQEQIYSMVEKFGDIINAMDIKNLREELAKHIKSDKQNWQKRNKENTEMKLQLLRLQLLNLIQHPPAESNGAIDMLYTQYKKLGGNSYICTIYENYKKEITETTTQKNGTVRH